MRVKRGPLSLGGDVIGPVSDDLSDTGTELTEVTPAKLDNIGGKSNELILKM